MERSELAQLAKGGASVCIVSPASRGYNSRRKQQQQQLLQQSGRNGLKRVEEEDVKQQEMQQEVENSKESVDDDKLNKSSSSVDDFFDNFQQQIQIRFLDINDSVNTCEQQVKSSIQSVLNVLSPKVNSAAMSFPNQELQQNKSSPLSPNSMKSPKTTPLTTVVQAASTSQATSAAAVAATAGSKVSPRNSPEFQLGNCENPYNQPQFGQQQSQMNALGGTPLFPSIEQKTARSFRAHSLASETNNGAALKYAIINQRNNCNAEDNIFHIRDHKFERQRILSTINNISQNNNNVSSNEGIPTARLYKQPLFYQNDSMNHSRNNGLQFQEKIRTTGSNFAVLNRSQQGKDNVFRLTFRPNDAVSQKGNLNHDCMNTSCIDDSSKALNSIKTGGEYGGIGIVRDRSDPMKWSNFFNREEYQITGHAAAAATGTAESQIEQPVQQLSYGNILSGRVLKRKERLLRQPYANQGNDQILVNNLEPVMIDAQNNNKNTNSNNCNNNVSTGFGGLNMMKSNASQFSMNLSQNQLQQSTKSPASNNSVKCLPYLAAATKGELPNRIGIDTLLLRNRSIRKADLAKNNMSSMNQLVQSEREQCSETLVSERESIGEKMDGFTGSEQISQQQLPKPIRTVKMVIKQRKDISNKSSKVLQEEFEGSHIQMRSGGEIIAEGADKENMNENVLVNQFEGHRYSQQEILRKQLWKKSGNSDVSPLPVPPPVPAPLKFDRSNQRSIIRSYGMKQNNNSNVSQLKNGGEGIAQIGENGFAGLKNVNNRVSPHRFIRLKKSMSTIDQVSINQSEVEEHLKECCGLESSEGIADQAGQSQSSLCNQSVNRELELSFGRGKSEVNNTQGNAKGVNQIESKFFGGSGHAGVVGVQHFPLKNINSKVSLRRF